jgi:hypothetical protein
VLTAKSEGELQIAANLFKKTEKIYNMKMSVTKTK